MIDVVLSVLETAMAEEGHTAGDALAATTAPARCADELGYRRVWAAEHHDTAERASASPPASCRPSAEGTQPVRVAGSS